MRRFKPTIAFMFFLAIAGTAVLRVMAEPSLTDANRGYASDQFDGFSALDNDTRIPQKKPSWRFWLKYDTYQEQLAHADGLRADGELKAARKAYEALVRKWPTEPESMRCQYAIGQILEEQKKYSKAFDEYQYLLVHFSGSCPYYEILDRQFRIANWLLNNNVSMFGWKLSGYTEVRERFETIVRNAPRSACAPEAMLIIAGIRESEREYSEAIKVYDGILNRFPKSEQAVSAAYLDSKCRHMLSIKQRDNEARNRETIAFLKALLERQPNHPQKSEIELWYREHQAMLEDQNYQKAVFYDSSQRSLDASQNAYRRFLQEFPNSRYAPTVKARLEALEKGAPPLK
ncbi:MAG: tetratricopeptide repeat protein [Kiritimatiellae bacterium]|nr:tetratricopeptide repeat protein [Kiritimatiellia bacterium]